MMKIELLNVRSITNRIETLKFKEFCSGGPQKHRSLPSKIGGSSIVYSLYINPLAFFDPTFIAIGAGIVAVAILERALANNGLISIASFLSTILRLSLPGVALASIIYLINHSTLLL
jgi:hypothetical protein